MDYVSGVATLKQALADSIQKLGLIVVIATTVLVLALDTFNDLVLLRYFSARTAIALQSLVTLICAVLFTWVLFSVLHSIRDRLARQNEELSSLHTAGLAINHDLKLDVVLQRVADEARRIIGARYSALMTMDHSAGSRIFFAVWD